jgi:hypothetical protein
MKKIPSLMIKVQNEIIYISNYIQKCSQLYPVSKSNEWCSIIKVYNDTENNEKNG